jgi:hypothetical protein
MTKALEDVKAERERQKAVEGWTPEHDDEHTAFEMSRAAAWYAMVTAINASPPARPDTVSSKNPLELHKATELLWPREWDSLKWAKPKGARRNLVRAAALLLAEIERLDRIAEAD